jgi:hypothetical protein
MTSTSKRAPGLDQVLNFKFRNLHTAIFPNAAAHLPAPQTTVSVQSHVASRQNFEIGLLLSFYMGLNTAI